MSIKKITFLVCFLGFTFGFAQNETLFNEATELYNNGEYSAAIENYKEILENGEHSASLYFNLGNCYYKLNAIGPSIYYYEKALLLSPNNEEIKNNLRFAQNMRLDAIEEMPKTELSRIYSSIVGMFGYNKWAYFAVVFVFLFVLAYMAYYFLRPANQKRAAFISSMFSLALCVACVLLAYLNHQQNKNNDPAIVFSKEVNVNSEPNSNSNTIFTIHEGTKVNILDELDDWRRIRIADGQTGWLQAENVKKIKDF
ncbi:tetratricopeptide repeat protein [[Muricauda] lutisoli]|uniref:Tetratricopeptide repeat protein n=1 Tax=[Muricauda] lutisoli TaxID=2816035 RepID=A0ABS3EX11_9FLAO|nr:tetratricopeptide repeat protein [[Muricauda] lutisoli]MBO0330771.1 tetratricopeptide repeat protein [[Muricauda] lutisoli]